MKPLFTLALLALPAFAAFPNGYTYCKVVTTQHTMVSGTSDLTNYPLTVILTDNDLRTAGNGGLVNNADGYDIGFYPDCSGSGAALKWEMESYSPTTGAIVTHVLRPTLSHTADDTIGMFYGGSFSSFQSTPSAVWDANYKGVWHLPNGTSLTANDSTSNAINGTLTNTPAAATGKIDGAGGFVTASSQYIDLGTPAGLDQNRSFTLSGWFNKSANQLQSLLSHGDHKWYLRLNSAGKLDFLESQVADILVATTALSSSAWHYAVLTVGDGTPATVTIYADGSADGTTTTSATFNSGGTQTVKIGVDTDNTGAIGEVFGGSLDELRISNVARSADWILTEYRNQSAPGTYLSAGPRIMGEGGGSRVRHVVIGGV